MIHKSSIIAVLICLVLSGCSADTTGRVPTSDADIFVYSHMFTTRGGIVSSTTDGLPSVQASLSVQDLFYAAHDADYYVMAGARKNNVLTISKDGTWTQSFLLDNPRYTGVLAVELTDDAMIALMNGGVKNNVYTSLLVNQKIGDSAFSRCEVDIWAEALIVKDGVAYILGTTIHPRRYAAIITVDIEQNIVIQQQVFPYYSQFTRAVWRDGSVYAIAQKGTSHASILSRIDPDTLTITHTQATPDEYLDLVQVDGRLYAISERSIDAVDETLDIHDSTPLTLGIHPHEDGYIDAIDVFGHTLVITYRFDARQKGSPNTLYGYVIRVDLPSGVERSRTPILLPASTDNVVQHIHVVPREFFE
ncbi:MAG: hypothetical protein FWD75_04410 [Propionibacteriaceae bacterium]|nr:hypothetical protein [Propionibacteriaceae bacterium]